MIVFRHHDSLEAEWLLNRIGLVPTRHFKCLANVIDGRVVGAVGYDGFNGASVHMHSAGDGNWVTKKLLWAAFDYPFNACKLGMVIGVVPSGNAQALKFNENLGFTTQCKLEGAHPDGSLILMTMRREQCRFLNLRRRSHGQEISA